MFGLPAPLLSSADVASNILGMSPVGTSGRLPRCTISSGTGCEADLSRTLSNRHNDQIGNERDESPRSTGRAGNKARATLKREISPQPVERDNGPVAEADQKVDVSDRPDQPGNEAA